MNIDDVIAKLTPYQALLIIGRLAARGEIREAVLAEAMNVLNDVDVAETAEDVFAVLDDIDVEECWDRAGASRDGYTSPDAAAAEIIDEELEPFLDQANRYHDLGMFEQELAQCQGVVLGLYRYERESKSEFRGWCEDIPGDCAWAVVDDWRKRNQSAARLEEMQDFIREHCPEWAKLLTR
jgi:hypothetical protein